MSTRSSRSLREGWRVVRSGGSVDPPVALPEGGLAAEVPGCVHLDLIRHGLLIDPDQGDGEAAQMWVGRTDWTWRREMSDEIFPMTLIRMHSSNWSLTHSIPRAKCGLTANCLARFRINSILIAIGSTRRGSVEGACSRSNSELRSMSWIGSSIALVIGP